MITEKSYLEAKKIINDYESQQLNISIPVPGEYFDTKPKICTICSNKDEDKITNIIKGQETNAWFCLKCGGLIGWIK